MNIEDLYPGLDTQSLRQITALCRNLESVSEDILVKDLFVTGMLRKVVETSPDKSKIYFKGGTAMAKCHHIIERFSEDCDLYVYSGVDTSGRNTENILNGKVTSFIQSLFGESLKVDKDGVPEGMRTGDYKKCVFTYDDGESGSSLFHKEVVFEISSCPLHSKKGMGMNAVILPIRPLVSEILSRHGYDAAVEAYSLQPFLVQCADPRKTLCDKISRALRICSSTDPVSQMAKYIRDAYDITMMLRRSEFKDYLLSDQFMKDMYFVNLEDRQRKRRHANQPASSALLFTDPDELFSSPLVKTSYNTTVEMLAFNKSTAPAIYEVVNSYKSLLQPLARFDEYRIRKDIELAIENGFTVKSQDTAESLLNDDQRNQLRLCGRIDGFVSLQNERFSVIAHPLANNMILLLPEKRFRAIPVTRNISVPGCGLITLSENQAQAIASGFAVHLGGSDKPNYYAINPLDQNLQPCKCYRILKNEMLAMQRNKKVEQYYDSADHKTIGRKLK